MTIELPMYIKLLDEISCQWFGYECTPLTWRGFRRVGFVAGD